MHWFYWPHLCKDLESAYVPACIDCQRNKSSIAKSIGPLHFLPVPDNQGDLVAIDFIELLPLDEGFDCIMTLMDCLGLDM
jgi:hypothetical protein